MSKKLLLFDGAEGLEYIACLLELELWIAGWVEPVLELDGGGELEAELLDVVSGEAGAGGCALAGNGGAECADVAQAYAAVGDDGLFDFVLECIEHGLGIGRADCAAPFNSLGDGVEVNGRDFLGHCVILDGIVHGVLAWTYYILEHNDKILFYGFARNTPGAGSF